MREIRETRKSYEKQLQGIKEGRGWKFLTAIYRIKKSLETDKMKERLGFAIVGCGKQGVRRIDAICKIPDEGYLACVVDTNKEKAMEIGKQFNCDYYIELNNAITRNDVNCVIVATPNKFHAPITIAALENKKHVLCEKPLARNPTEAKEMVNAASKNGVFLKTGSNHRYFPNVLKARELIDKNAIGKLLFLRAWIGHEGGRLKDTWFWNKVIAGGGTFLDNGCHLLDITRWFLGEINECVGYAQTNYWPIEIEDNAFGLFKTREGKIAFIQASWTQWSGYMYMEIYGTEGYIFVDCRFCNKTIYGLKDQLVQVFDFSFQPQQSYDLEIRHFIKYIKESKQPLPSGYDGMRVVQMTHAIYESSKSGSRIKVPPEYE